MGLRVLEASAGGKVPGQKSQNPNFSRPTLRWFFVSDGLGSSKWRTKGLVGMAEP